MSFCGMKDGPASRRECIGEDGGNWGSIAGGSGGGMPAAYHNRRHVTRRRVTFRNATFRKVTLQRLACLSAHLPRASTAAIQRPAPNGWGSAWCMPSEFQPRDRAWASVPSTFSSR